MLSTPMTSRRRTPMASSWKLKTTLRRKKSLAAIRKADERSVIRHLPHRRSFRRVTLR
jgi:hypothetical protein